MPEFISDGDLGALVLAVVFVLGVFCYWYCAFKCVTCLKKKEDRRNVITVSQRDYSNV